MTQSVLSPKMDELAKIADSVLIKKAAVDAATLAGGGGAGGAPPMDPAMAMAGMDPAMMGGDPAAMGGDPAAGGAPPGPDPMEQRLAALEAQLAAGGGGAGVEQIKPKIDTDSVLLSVQKMVAKLMDTMGVQMPPQDMVADSADLTQMAANPTGADPTAGGGSAIAPIDPMQGASPALAGGGGGEAKIASEGEAYDGSGLATLQHRADALFHMMSGGG